MKRITLIRDVPMESQIRRAKFGTPKRMIRRGVPDRMFRPRPTGGFAMADGTLRDNTSTNIEAKCAWCREHPGVLSTCLACAAERAFRAMVQDVAYYAAIEASDDALVVDMATVDYFDDPARIECIGDFTAFLEEWRTSGVDPADMERRVDARTEQDLRDNADDRRAASWEVRHG